MTENTQISLAAGAGAGLVKLVADDLLARVGFARRVADSLERALDATRRTWDSGTKQWIDEPDSRTQLQAVFGIFAHFEGEPIKRVIHEHLGQGHLQEALEEMPPAMLEAMQRRIEFARKKAKRAKPAQVAVDVEFET